jgi:rubredoxin
MRDMPANDETFEERESIIQKTISANVRAYRFVERKTIGGYTAVIDLDNPVPTVFAEVNFTQKQATGKYVCSICGYIYDPDENDGTAFEDLPDDWKCPRCKQGKDKFNPA